MIIDHLLNDVNQLTKKRADLDREINGLEELITGYELTPSEMENANRREEIFTGAEKKANELENLRLIEKAYWALKKRDEINLEIRRLSNEMEEYEALKMVNVQIYQEMQICMSLQERAAKAPGSV